MTIPVEYEQTDLRWRGVLYTSCGNRNQTIGATGCGPTCAAMVVATLRNKSVTPIEACKYAVDNGFRTADDGTAWGFFAKYFSRYNIPVKQTGTLNEALTALKNNLMVITAASKGIWTNGGHFILAYGLTQNGTKVLIHDPNSEQTARELADISKYKAQTTQYWIINEPYDKEDEEVEIKAIKIKDLDRNKTIDVDAVNIAGANFIRIRDIEKLFPWIVGNEGATPTIKQNLK